ncbi:50S ribosomal protein L16 [Candidatus Peregrinibacteria bacterium]|nr:50S ribosomal protein L16 [Candidatus Peregrinibacteria bacterium]
MLQPKKTKHRKHFRNRGGLEGPAQRGAHLAFGSYGLKAITAGELTARQIEAARKAMTKFTKKGGRIWIRVFPDKIITRKAAEVPMGSGKGTPEFFATEVQAGKIVFEMDGIPESDAKRMVYLAGQKLPVKCKFINKRTLI